MRDLSSIAEQLRQKGRSGDTILAHINPAEAELLRGGQKQSINPHTGLPEFKGGGFWHSFARVALGKPSHRVTREMKAKGTYRKPRPGNWALAALPLAAGPLGAGLGAALGLPLGAMAHSALSGGLAGVLGNSLQGKNSILRQNPAMAFMGGAGKGIASSGITNELANLFNANPYSGFGKAIGMREPFFAGLRSNLAPPLEEDFVGATAGGKPGMGDFSKMASVIGKMYPGGAGSTQPEGGGYGPEYEEDMFPMEQTTTGMTPGGATKNAMASFKGTGKSVPGAGQMQGGVEALDSPFSNSQLLEMLMKMLREHPERREEILQEISKVKGGGQRLKAGGYVHGKSGGQTDDVPTKLASGSYVMNATDVSLLGDGNSNHGATKLKEFEQHIQQHSPIVSGKRENTKKVNALVSDGEYIILKDVVDRLGKGDNRKGARLLDDMRKKLRTHKGVKTILPPKSKPLMSYMGRI